MDSAGAGGLGSASGEITLSAAGALRALDQVSSGLRNLDSQTRAQGSGLLSWSSANEKSINTLGTGILGVGGAFLTAFGLSTNVMMDFESQISAVGSVAGASESELASLREEALRLGADTTFSASEAASAMEVMLKAGAPLESVLNGGTEAILNLSAATGVDVPLAAETAATAMNTFGVSAEEAADLIAQSANASSLDVQDWALALKSVGPVAASLGMDMDDLAAAMVILGDAGIKGEVGATALRNILLGIADPASAGAVALQEWGVATHDAEGNMRSLEAITHDLAGSWDTMSQSQKIALAEQIAGKDGVVSFMTLMDAQTEAVNNNSDAFVDAKTRMDETGTAQTQAAARMDNLKGSFEQFKGTLETIAITFTSGLAPALRTGVDGINRLLQGVLGLPAPLQTAIGALTGIVGVLGVAGGGFLLMLPRIAETVNAFKTLGGVAGMVKPLGAALGALTSPVGLVVIGIAALAAGAVYLYRNWEPFRNVVNTVASALKSFAMGPVLDFLKQLGGYAKTAYNALKDFAGGALSRGISSIASGFKTAFNAVKTFVQGIDNVQDGFNDVLSVIGTVRGIVSSFFSDLASRAGVFGDSVRTIGTIVDNVFSAVTSIIQGVAQLFSGDLSGALGSFGDAFQSVWSNAGESLKLLGNLIVDTFQAIDWGGFASAAGNFFSGLGSAALNALQGLGDAIQIGLQLAWDAITSLDWASFIPGLDWVLYVGELLWDSFLTLLDWGSYVAEVAWGAWLTVLSWGQYVGDLLWSGFVSAVDLAKKVGAFAWSSFVTAVDLAKKVGAFAWSSFVTALDSWADFISSISWSSFVPNVSWSSFIPNLSWPSKNEILDALVDHFLGGDSDDDWVPDGPFPEGVDTPEQSDDGGTEIPYNDGTTILTGGFGNFDGKGMAQLPGIFSAIAAGVAAVNAVLPTANLNFAGLTAQNPKLLEFGGAAQTSFTNAGAAAIAGLMPIGGIASTMAGSLLGSVLPAFGGVSTSAQSNFASMQSAIAGQTLAASLAASANSLSMSTGVKGNMQSMSTDAAAKAAEMNRSVNAETLGMQVAALGKLALLKATSTLHFMGMASSAREQGTAMSTALRTGANNAASAVSSALSRIPGIINGIAGQGAAAAYNAGAAISAGFANGMLAYLGQIQSAASAMVAAASAAVVAKAMISSPSKLFRGFGEYVGEGFEIGIRSMIPDVSRAAAALVNTPNLPGFGSPYTPAYAYSTPSSSSVSNVIYQTTVLTIPPDEWVKVAREAERGGSHATHWQQVDGAAAYIRGGRR